MDRADFVLKNLNPVGHLHQYLNQEVRPDGRSLLEHRDTSISTSVYPLVTQGSSLISCGGTVMSCGINFEIGTTHVSHPNSGDLMIDVSLLPLCSLQFDRSKSNEAYEVEAFLKDVLIRGKVLDLSQLSITPGKNAFRLCVRLVCLSYDGNLSGVSLLAVMAALKTTNVPKAVALECSQAPHQSAGKTGSSGSAQVGTDIFSLMPGEELLQCSGAPVAVTCGVAAVTYDDENKQECIRYVLDPSPEELPLLDEVVTCVFSSAADMLFFSKASGNNSSGNSRYKSSMEHIIHAIEVCRKQALMMRDKHPVLLST